MKNFILALILCLIPVIVLADDELLPQPSKPLEYTEVVKVEGTTKDQLFSSALAWFGETFRSAQNVIDVQDKDAGRIIGKALFSFEPASFLDSAARGVVRYYVTIEIKESKYKYIIGRFAHESHAPHSGRSFGLLTMDDECPYELSGADFIKNKDWKKAKGLTESESKTLIASLKSRMALTTSKANDW